MGDGVELDKHNWEIKNEKKWEKKEIGHNDESFL